MTCKRHSLVSPQFANEDDDDGDDDGTIEPGNAACAWVQPNGVYIRYTHSMVKALGTSLQEHGYSADKNKILTTSLAHSSTRRSSKAAAE